MDLNKRPILVFWESTRACLLECRHCRAEALQAPLPGTLSSEKAKAFIEQITRFEKPFPVLVVTGGDPLMRSDFLELVAHARRLGIPVALSPAVSRLNETVPLDLLKELGIKVISVSLDGGKAKTHEEIRGIPDHFKETLHWINRLISSGFTVQVNTTVMKRNVKELPDIAALLHDAGVPIWEIFFLIKVGRGKEVDELSALECEAVGHFLYDVSCTGLIVRTVEAPFFRRIVAQRMDGQSNGVRAFNHPLYRNLKRELHQVLRVPIGKSKAQSLGTRDGSGIIFVNYKGDVYPSGFLPLALGNVQEKSLADIYLNAPELLSIRKGAFDGKCGKCEFAQICGGSRSRAYAATHNWLGEDPACAYIPRALLN